MVACGVGPVVMGFALTQVIDVSGPATVTVDRFGNERETPGAFAPVKVFAWSVNPRDEEQGDHVLRTIDELKVVLRAEDAPSPGGRFRTPDGQVWEVEGNPRDPNNNPWFRPGLVVCMGKKVTG